jgi:hypothetical protein
MTIDEALADVEARAEELKPMQEWAGGVYAPGILAAEVRRLREELETGRLRLAACGVVAHGGSAEGCLPEYRSDSLEATIKLRAKLARVETLAADWIARGHRSDMVHEDAGELVLEALRGEL